MKKHGKKFIEAAKKIEKEKLYPLSEAIKLALQTSVVKFDATVEVHVNTNTNPKYADQIIRSSIILPHGTGKSVKVAAFCDDNQEEKAKKAGADFVGSDELIEKVLKGKVNFDIAVAQPSLMKNLGKIAKILGPKGLMPSLKSGTVTNELEKIITEIKKGKIEFKNDKSGIVHTILGKVSFGDKKITENFNAFKEALIQAKPSGNKGGYLKKITITTSMGPGINIDLKDII